VNAARTAFWLLALLALLLYVSVVFIFYFLSSPSFA